MKMKDFISSLYKALFAVCTRPVHSTLLGYVLGCEETTDVSVHCVYQIPYQMNPFTE